MRVIRKKAISFLAALLAVLALLQPETASAAVSTSTSVKDSGVYWSSELPTDGDRSYKSDSKWYRLILEYGDYCTNSVDSNGFYADCSPGMSSSWPEKVWNDWYEVEDQAAALNESWIGSRKSEWVLNGSLLREKDYDLYRNNEYTEDGLYSLYIKYAGKSKKTGEDCWYISPCDENGDREQKLWALDCCLDVCEDSEERMLDWKTLTVYTVQANNVIKPIEAGISPQFGLHSPTFEEFETSEQFRYAGMALPYYKNNNGSILADYNDNNKWIITKNADGTWSVKSAGYIDWDWADRSGTFVQMFDDPASALANGLAHYSRITAAAQHSMLGSKFSVLSGMISMYAFLQNGMHFSTDNYEDYERFGPNALNGIPYVEMVFLSDYAENVYICGNYIHTGTSLTGKTDKAAGKELFSSFSVGINYDYGQICPCYGMQLNNELTEEFVNNALHDFYMGKDDNKVSYPAESMGVKVCDLSPSDDSSTEKQYRYYSVDEIKATLPISFSANWKPARDSGAFTGLYVGACLKTEKYAESNGSVTIDNGTTVVLGAPDKNGDGINDGAAHIGTLVEYDYHKMLGTGFGPHITIEKGGVLQIDGPTYVAFGTSFTVKGTLIINAGAFLTYEDMDIRQLGGVSALGVTLDIDGGSVYVSSGAILDVGYADITLKNGGSLVNNGIFIQDTHDEELYSRITMNGGSIENGSTAWFVSGAEVLYKQRQSLMRSVAADPSISTLAKHLTGMLDYDLIGYARYPFEETGITEFVTMMMYASENANVFRNTGNALITGAVKGSGDNAGSLMDSGKIYRFWDIVADKSISLIGCDYSTHERFARNSGQNVYENETIKAFNAYTGIEYTTSGVIPDEDADTIASRNNVYALRVGTGSQGTEKISNFIVNYMDKTGVERSEYISPATIGQTYRFVADWRNCGTGENEEGTSRLRTAMKPGTDPMSTVMSNGNFPASLQPVSNVTYIFQALYPLDYVTSISFAGAGSGAWTCTELNVYRVSYLYPLEEYGWRSSDWYVPFTGSLIAETAMTKDKDGINSVNFSWDSETIEIGTGVYQLNVYGAPSNVESRTDVSGFAYYNVSHDTVPYSTTDKEYTFSIKLADANKAGIEAYYFPGIETSLNDLLSAAEEVAKLESGVTFKMGFTYVDTTGSVRRVELPVMQSAVEWAFFTTDSASREAPLHGLFQQGEDIVFRGTLPDFKRGVDAALTYNDSSGGDAVGIAAITLNDSGYVEVGVRDGMLKVDYPETAVSFYCAPDPKGVMLNNGQTMSVSLKDWNGTESLRPKSKGSKYLVVVQTDSMSEAGTVNDITASFTYKTLSGISSSTQAYSLNSLVNDYYGFWLTSEGYDDNCAYRTAVSAGQQMYFVLDVTNLYKFDTATFTMAKPGGEDTQLDGVAGDGNDEWQMKAITIYELEELGNRQVLLGSGISLPGLSTNRTYFRDNLYGSRGAINSAKGPLMIGPGQSKTINFEDGGISGGGEGIDKNKATDVKDLSYEETKQDFGFNKKRCAYSITVKVAGDSITSAEDGDCGSKNQFYFQLVFQNDEGKVRTSPCVLANQQLQSDGFRTGTKEEFMIYTNDDYGTPVQINIIPDDTSSVSDVFDKLNIDYINVSKTSGTGVNLSWKAENVGWIDIEYKDDAEEQTGRSNEELIRSFELKDAGYSVTLEFGIETAADYVDDRQFVGQVLADITYRDTSGAPQTSYNVDVIAQMADYAERKSQLPTTPVDGTQISLPEFMFKNGYTNRFQYTFDDISSLIKIKLKIIPTEDITWKVNKVFARQVFNNGTLSFNIFDEFERHYSIDPQDLTSSDNAKAVTVTAVAGEQTFVTFNFNSGNNIKVDLTEGEETVVVDEGDSKGLNDVISLTAELTESGGVAAGTSLPVKVIYKNIYGDAYAVSSTLIFDAATNKFMVPQNSLPKTPDIGMPYKIEVTGGAALAGRQLEVVTVNQIRDRQVIEQFNFVPDTGTRLESAKPVTILLPESEQDEYAKRKGYITNTQMVFLQLGALTEKTLLTETQDLQIALVYTEKDDPYNYEHISDFVSAMRCGYTVVNADSVLRIPMNVRNVGAVKSVLLKTSGGGMKVNVSKACISIEEISNISGDRLSSGWVNLPAETGMIYDEGTAMNTDGASLEQAMVSNTRVSPVNIAAEFSKINRSDAIVKVTVNYLDMQNAGHSVSYEMTANDWNRDSVWILTEGLKNVQYYKVEVYDKDTTNTAGVTVGSLSISWYNSSGVYTSANYTGDMVLTEGTSVSNSVLNTQLAGSVFTTDGTQRVALENNHVNVGRTDYDKITLTGTGEVSVSADLAGFPGELEMFVINTSTGETLFGTVAENAGSENLTYTFAPPINSGTANVRYSVNIRSKNMPDSFSAIVYVDVEPAVFIEGMVFAPDDTMLANFLAMAGNTNDSFIEYFFYPGNVVKIYARAVNDANPLQLSVMPEGTTVMSVNSVSGVVRSGFEGTWTEYDITMNTVEYDTVFRLTLASVRCPQVNCSFSFRISPATP